MFKKATKIQLTMLILLAIFGYLYRSQIYLGSLYVYSFTGSPHAERLIGEHYNFKSYQFSKKAALHLQKALYRYKMALPLSPDEQKKWIEFLIGSHYECGRGTKENIATARKWYQQAAKKGLRQANVTLELINEALQKVESEQNNQ